MAAEWALFSKSTFASGVESTLAKDSSPLGVTSSFQYWDPYPLSIVSAKGAWMTDVDGRQLLDLSMGFGAMLAGHLNEEVIAETKSALEGGTLFVTPSPISRDGSERLCKRFGIDKVRFANSGTEATMYAVRTAKAYNGKSAIVKLEGGYHGSYDPLTVSAKPDLDLAGDPEEPNPVVGKGISVGVVFVVPFNNLPALEKVFARDHESISCFILEPVLENLGIVLPDAGYLAGVRELCTKYNIVLIFDEVKTGLTAGPQGAAHRIGVQPDLICLAKSIGGGLPLAAFGGKAEIMDTITTGAMAHFGTFNGNPLAMAGLRAMDRLCTVEALARAEAFNEQALDRIQLIIEEFQLPAHTVGFGVKGCVTWSKDPVRNYRDYKATDFAIAELSWLWSMNRRIITPPGLDEQWLISLAHGQKEIDLLVENFRSFAVALRS
ncbi:MAG: aminotransferase class III-fold pyridoxal phosphate-dependent enzyme [Actinomycetes bacterium]